MGEMVKKKWREESRKEWFSNTDQAQEISHEALNSGSFMRMADSLESIAKDKTRLEQDAKYWKDSSKRKDEEIKLLNNKIRGFKSRITTLSGKIVKLGGNP